jgi:hypothetical protein
MLVNTGNDAGPTQEDPMGPALTTFAHRRGHQVLNEETTMHPEIGCHLAEAHVADMRHRAQRDTLARAARRTRQDQPGRSQSGFGAWGRRAHAGLVARIALVPGVARTPTRAYPTLSSPSEEGHAHNPE